MKNMICVAVVLLAAACAPVFRPLGQPERYPERVSPVDSTCDADAYTEPNGHRCLDKHLLLKHKMKRRFKGRQRGTAGSRSVAATGAGHSISSAGESFTPADDSLVFSLLCDSTGNESW